MLNFSRISSVLLWQHSSLESVNLLVAHTLMTNDCVKKPGVSKAYIQKVREGTVQHIQLLHGTDLTAVL